MQVFSGLIVDVRIVDFLAILLTNVELNRVAREMTWVHRLAQVLGHLGISVYLPIDRRRLALVRGVILL